MNRASPEPSLSSLADADDTTGPGIRIARERHWRLLPEERQHLILDGRWPEHDLDHAGSAALFSASERRRHR
ncbi:hypothetical protein SAMN02983003_2089 [Devosia enhydra]|uniref:Uncharacterized protein n=1 Tax=Devosia enhydra TaxID=665118 RepID=A0A1K2HY67_9HYPH|nr:hypothetical protein [Devosia enhydra]SFZ84570.1 hypothetical protein SAMN02983003_2089 [Devosia enhydra]